MDTRLLKQFIQSVLRERQDFRVPNQLVSKKRSVKEKPKADEDDVEEASVASAIAGAPGLSSTPKKNSKETSWK